MDRADNGCAYKAFEFASPGETVFWRNPDSHVEYGITPARLTRTRRQSWGGAQCTATLFAAAAVFFGSVSSSTPSLYLASAVASSTS